jgi:uncharacterized protein
VTRSLVVSVHDVSPATAKQTRRWLAELDRRRVPASLLVIPGYWRSHSLDSDAQFAAYLRGRAAAGDEIVQHGWRHAVGPDRSGHRALAERILARGAGEFAAIGRHCAELRLQAGRRVLADAGLLTDAFTAPGWLHSPGTMSALRDLGFRYTTDHFGVIDLQAGRRVHSLALSHRPAGLGEGAAAAMIRRAPLLAGLGATVRIALHPDDLSRPGLVRATLAAIDGCLAAGAEPITYRQLLAPAPARSGA